MENKRTHKRIFCYLGFTMIEMVIALSLFTVVVVSAYGAFRSGFVAYQRIESQLGRRHELDMLVRQIGSELRNALYYAPVPFEGKSDKIQFPARLWRYDSDQLTEDLYQVTYQFRDGHLMRSEQKLKQEFSQDRNPEAESLIPLTGCKFQFAYKLRDGELVWKNELLDKPYQGLPRAIRVLIQEKKSGSTEEAFEFLVPQGMLTQLLTA